MWTSTPVDNLLTKHTEHEIKTLQSCKQGYIFQHTCAIRRSSRNWDVKKKKKCDLQFLQFLWPSSINVCLELKCRNPEIVVCANSAATPIL